MRSGVILLWLVGGLSCLAQAQVGDVPQAVAIDLQTGDPISLQRFSQADAAIKLDGLLTEPVWSEVPYIDELLIVEPDTLDEPIYSSKIRLFYTDRGLYISVDLEQPADTLVQRFSVRDDFELSRDVISISLDTSGDGRYGYWMSLALGDNQMDGTILPERQYSREWDGAWYGATSVTEGGWSVEFLIPWSQMAMPKRQGTRTIGMYASRKVAHLNQRWGWPGLPASRPRFISQFQPLHLDGVDPRQQWSLFPYASSTYDAVDSGTRYKAGFDAFWRPSTNFQLTATVNPDFGAVESDDVDVNLTANETFFPEKRLFFQEGQEIFNTSPRSSGQSNFNRFVIVNTRRIGSRPRELDLPPGFELSDRQELRPAELYGAGKFTGQIGSFRYGALAAFEKDTTYNVDGSSFTQDGRDFATVRFIYEDSNNASYRGLGFISTLVAHPESDAFVNGVDAHFLSTTGVWKFEGQFVHSDIDEEGSGIGVLADIAYQPRQGLQHSLQATWFDEEVDVNDFGFQQRNDMREARYRVEVTKSGLTRVRDMTTNWFIRHRENAEGLTTDGSIGMFYEINTNNLDHVSGSIRWTPERFDDQNSFDNGTFRVEAKPIFHIAYRTNSARPLSLHTRFEYEGEDTGGYKTEFSVGAIWQPVHNLRMQASLEFEDRNGWLLHEDDINFTEYNAPIFQPEVRVEYFPTAKQQVQLVMQWVGIRAEEDRFYILPPGTTELVEVPDPLPPGETYDFSISQLNFQLRYRWQIAPLSDLFIVYTKGDRRNTDLASFSDLFSASWQDPLINQVIVKIRYRLGS